MNTEGFALMPHDSSKEVMAAISYCTLHNFRHKIFHNWKEVPENYVPVGTVEWCSKILRKPTIPNYYPEFLNHVLHRKVWTENKWPLGKQVFIKPADKYKRFTGFITSGTRSKKKRGPFVCSDVVNFVNEWRYYITNGKVVASEWYFGDEINTPPAPDLKDYNISFPDGFCCAADFGVLDTGVFALIEVQHPFACGWYGVGVKTGCIYAQWLIDGWNYLKK